MQRFMIGKFLFKTPPVLTRLLVMIAAAIALLAIRRRPGTDEQSITEPFVSAYVITPSNGRRAIGKKMRAGCRSAA